MHLSALGGSGRRWWFIDGQPVGETANDVELNHPFTHSSHYQLSVLDESDQSARLEFTVND